MKCNKVFWSHSLPIGSMGLSRYIYLSFAIKINNSWIGKYTVSSHGSGPVGYDGGTSQGPITWDLDPLDPGATSSQSTSSHSTLDPGGRNSGGLGWENEALDAIPGGNVDGSEIRRENHLGWKVKPYEYWDIYYINWWMPDFFHQHFHRVQNLIMQLKVPHKMEQSNYQL